MNRTTIERLKVFLEETKGHDQFTLSLAAPLHEPADLPHGVWVKVGGYSIKFSRSESIKFSRSELVDLLEAARDATPIVLEGGPLGRRCAKNIDGHGARCLLDRGHSGPCR